MRSAILLSCMLMLSASGLAAAGDAIVFRNVNLVPMTTNKVISGQTVVVADGKIARIGSARKISIPEGATVIDGAGKYLMPGLADMHTHLNDAMFEYPFFNLFLANGVTTIRDLAQGSPPMVLHYRGEIESGTRLGPNILAAYTLWGWEKDLTGLVRGQRSLGYDCLKVNSYFSQAGFDTVMRETRRLEWYTLGHIPQMVRLDGVLAGGMNELSHIEELMIFEMLGIDWSKVTSNESFETQFIEAFHAACARYRDASADEIRAAFGDEVKRAVAKFKSKDISLTTTVVIHEDVMNKLVDLEKIKAAPYARYVAPKFWKDVAAGTDKHQQMIVKGDERAWYFVYELQNVLLQELRKAGVPLVLGTDVGPTFFSLVPGFAVHDELRLLAQNGFTPYEALSLATRRAGEVAGRMTGRNDFGTIEKGKRADLVLLERNPLENVDNARDPLGVMAGGRWLPRDTLAMLLTIKHKPILDMLKASYADGGIDAAMEAYRKLTEGNRYNEHRYGPGTLVQVGYLLLEDGKTDEALRVLRLNKEQYPADWNAWDSYGEACMKAGMKDEAIRSYERALEIDPTQENPRKMLRELRNPEASSRSIDIGTHSLRMRSMGERSPAVVIDAGLTDGLEKLAGLQERLAASVRVVTYDRAGYGGSGFGPMPRTVEREAAEMLALLEKASVPGPYVMVGHSLGALNAMMFAAKYPDRVAGIVLLDPPPIPFLLGRDYKDLAAMSERMTAEWERIAAAAATSADPGEKTRADYYRSIASEHRELFGASAKQVDAIGTLGDIPLLVMAAGKPNPAFGAVAGEYQIYWIEQSRALVGKSSEGRFVLVENASHYIYVDAPERVSEAILSLVAGAH